MKTKYGRFFAEWRDESGRRLAKSFKSRREAQRFQDQIRAEVRALKVGGSVRELTEQWLAAHPGGKRDRYYERMAAAALIEVAGRLPAKDLSYLIPNALIDRWKSKFSVATIYNLRFALRRICEWLESHGAQHLVSRMQKTPTPQPRQVLIDAADLEKIKAISPPWFRCFILLCFDGGLRRNEAIKLSPKNYSEETGKITIEVKKRRIQSFVATDELRAIFAMAPIGDAPYLELLKGRRVTRSSVEVWWQKIKEKAGTAKGINTHDLRRTAATELYLKTHDIFLVQKFLGHANPVTTLRYIAHAANLELKPVVEEMKVIFSKRTARGGIARAGALA